MAALASGDVSSLHMAAMSGGLDAVRYLLQVKCPPRYTAVRSGPLRLQVRWFSATHLRCFAAMHRRCCEVGVAASAAPTRGRGTVCVRARRRRRRRRVLRSALPGRVPKPCRAGASRLPVLLPPLAARAATGPRDSAAASLWLKQASTAKDQGRAAD